MGSRGPAAQIPQLFPNKSGYLPLHPEGPTSVDAKIPQYALKSHPQPLEPLSPRHQARLPGSDVSFAGPCPICKHLRSPPLTSMRALQGDSRACGPTETPSRKACSPPRSCSFVRFSCRLSCSRASLSSSTCTLLSCQTQVAA